MTLRNQLLFWAIGLIVFGICLVALSGIMLPFVAGMAVAYFLDPVADKFEEWGASRTLATVVITVLFMLIAIGGFVLLLPLLYQQIVDFIARVPTYTRAISDIVAPLSESLIARLDPEDVQRVRDAIGGVTAQLVKWALGLVQNIWKSGLAIVNILSLLFITPIVAFYLLRDWDRIVERIDALLPRDHADVIRTQVKAIDETLAGFVRGQGLVCLALAVFYVVGLLITGLDFALVLGLLAGLISFIPYVGAIVGLIASVGMAFLQFDDFVRIGAVAIVFVIGQVLEGNVLTPKLVGDRVGLHPVWVIFGILAGGVLFGFVGILIAVPMTAIVGVLVRFAVERYSESPLYRGTSAPVAGQDGEPPD